MNDLLELFKVLSDETRLRIINLLKTQSLCVCELVDILELTQPKISKHIAKLRAINLVNTKRNEQYIYYSLNEENDDYLKVINVVFGLDNKLLAKDLDKINKIESFVCTK
ncbi:HTH-type transcriptional repressor AseR [Candidatus Izimaplasma bacterium HR1]|jgi:ArsR family transcriptional regulator|uniref:ArsR/SmtB family transcription factor n=1 Tax=Candidatus Izimoplasma sp. HR1 TaxID=1541959 RepID=UPI0004F695CB|nr:HTH-type transcriptional repressor AseR [Candidatus Izimaplasma bacterium HR1]